MTRRSRPLGERRFAGQGWATAAICLLTSALAMGACMPAGPVRPPISVASGGTARQLVLGHLTLGALEDDGYRVVDRTGLGDAAAVRRVLLAGSADIAWEYTGTVWSALLGHDQPMPEAQELYMRVRGEDLPRGITWLPPTSCRQRAGVVMREDVAEAASVATVGDLVTYMASKTASPMLCVSSDLVDAMNGLSGLRLVYGWTLSPGRTRSAEDAEALRLLRQDECQAALVTDADDAAVAADIVMLSDVKALFGASDLAVAARTDILIRYPMLEARLTEIVAALSHDELLRMEEQVARGARPRTVARRFLTAAHLAGRYRATPEPAATARPTVTPGPTFTAIPTTEAVRTATPPLPARAP